MPESAGKKAASGCTQQRQQEARLWPDCLHTPACAPNRSTAKRTHSAPEQHVKQNDQGRTRGLLVQHRGVQADALAAHDERLRLRVKGGRHAVEVISVAA